MKQNLPAASNTLPEYKSDLFDTYGSLMQTYYTSHVRQTPSSQTNCTGENKRRHNTGSPEKKLNKQKPGPANWQNNWPGNRSVWEHTICNGSEVGKMTLIAQSRNIWINIITKTICLGLMQWTGCSLLPEDHRWICWNIERVNIYISE